MPLLSRGLLDGGHTPAQQREPLLMRQVLQARRSDEPERLDPRQLGVLAEEVARPIYALSAAHEPLSSFEPDTSETNEFLASPVVDGATLYIGSTDGTLYALDSSDGSPL